MKCKRSDGFTLIELLVVITIIGMLMALLMPAVNAARENARQLKCKNNIKQLAYGCTVYESTHGFFPSGGWGWAWVGNANEGAGLTQPGGWLYSILPHIDQENLYNLGFNTGGNKSDDAQNAERLEAIKTVTPLFYCPSRREPRGYQCGGSTPSKGISVGGGTLVGKCDYAGNGGNGWGIGGFGDGGGFSKTTSEQQWRDSGDATFIQEYLGAPSDSAKISSGVVQRRYPLPANGVKDGLGQTYLLGEKYLDAGQYEGAPGNDDQGWSVGFDQDNVRFSKHNTPSKTKPYRDTPGFGSPEYAFGSAHPSFFFMAMCDATVRPIKYTISADVHARLGIRNDLNPVNPNDF